ncbi:hypothetical protein SK128_006462 [Halocaridina rubra]|uniref:Uncharacterized protein n=1 Tax=Halocaridina rubra TaxID=373956 RepID=A0AAN8XHI5_HALRR
MRSVQQVSSPETNMTLRPRSDPSLLRLTLPFCTIYFDASPLSKGLVSDPVQASLPLRVPPFSIVDASG